MWRDKHTQIQQVRLTSCCFSPWHRPLRQRWWQTWLQPQASRVSHRFYRSSFLLCPSSGTGCEEESTVRVSSSCGDIILPSWIKTHRVVEAWARMLPPIGFLGSAENMAAPSTCATTWLVITTATPNCWQVGQKLCLRYIHEWGSFSSSIADLNTCQQSHFINFVYTHTHFLHWLYNSFDKVKIVRLITDPHRTAAANIIYRVILYI